MNVPILKGKKFVLRPLRKGDEEALARYANNRKIYAPTLHVPYPYTERDAGRFIRESIQERRKEHPRSINFAIEVDGEAVGVISLQCIEQDHEAELGYWLGEPFWGRGIMTEAARKVSGFGLKRLGLVRIYAGAFAWNGASQRVLEKAGFQREGLRRKHAKKDGRFVDDYLYAKVR